VQPVRFRILGPVEIESGDGVVFTLPRRHERCLLGILLLEAPRAVSTERLCDLLWDGAAGAENLIRPGHVCFDHRDEIHCDTEFSGPTRQGSR
jgi:hypothetical protein